MSQRSKAKRKEARLRARRAARLDLVMGTRDGVALVDIYRGEESNVVRRALERVGHPVGAIAEVDLDRVGREFGNRDLIELQQRIMWGI